MKKQLALILTCTMTFTACVENVKEKVGTGSGTGTGTETEGNGVTLSGTAATGAPVSNGTVIIKDKNGDSPSGEIKTDRNGKYTANVDNLEAPFLIHITAPSGEKLISVANQSDVRSGKKVNVTPLSHIVAANVFEVSDPDELLENFVATASTKYSDEKLTSKKSDLQTKLATVMSALNVSSSTDVMNGDFVAGSGEGLDKVLDAIKIKVDTADIKVTYKGSTEPIITTSPSGTTVDQAKITSGITAINTQLTTLEQIKAFLKSASTEYNNIITACKGDINLSKPDGCEPQEIYNRMELFLHTNYKWNGLSKSEDLWDWFCSNENNTDVESAEDCTIINDKAVEFSDVSIVSLNGDEATITMNMYMDNQLKGFETDYLKKEGGNWKFYGNQQEYEIWIGPQSIVRKTYNKGILLNKTFEAQLSMYLDSTAQAAFNGAASNIAIVAVDKDNNPVVALNDALAVANNGADRAAGGILLELRNMGNGKISFVVPAKEGTNNNGDYCDLDNDSDCYFNWQSTNISITPSVIAQMEQNQKFILRYTIGGVDYADVHYVSKPLILSPSTESKHAPFFENEATLCVESRSSYLVSAPTGSELNWANAMLGWQDSDQNYFEAKSEGSVDGSTDTLVPLINGSGAQVEDSIPLNWGHFYLSSDDSLRRQFTKQISCQNW